MKGSHHFMNLGKQRARLGIFLAAVIVAAFNYLGCDSNGTVEESGNPISVVDTTMEIVSNGEAVLGSALKMNELPDFLPSYPSYGFAEGYTFQNRLDAQGRIVQIVMLDPEGQKSKQYDLIWDGHRLVKQTTTDFEMKGARQELDFTWNGNIGRGGKGPDQEEIELDGDGRVVRRIVGDGYGSVLLNTYDGRGLLVQQVRCYQGGVYFPVRYIRYVYDEEGRSSVRYVDTEIDAEDFDEAWPEKGIGMFKFPDDFDKRAKTM